MKRLNKVPKPLCSAEVLEDLAVRFMDLGCHDTDMVVTMLDNVAKGGTIIICNGSWRHLRTLDMMQTVAPYVAWRRREYLKNKNDNSTVD